MGLVHLSNGNNLGFEKRESACYERASIFVSLIVLGLAFLPEIELPTRTFSFYVLGSLASIRLSTTWLMAALLASLACTGTDSLIRSHPLIHRGEIRYTFAFWALPGLSVVAATLLLPLASNRPYWLGGLALTALLLLLIAVAQYHTVDPTDPGYRLARLALNILVYLVALGLFILIYGSKTRSLLSATTTAAVGGLLALGLLRGVHHNLRLTGLYTLITGLALGEVTWALNYWTAGRLTGGLLLLLVFYLVTGLSQEGLLRRLNRRTLVEFALVALVGLGLIIKYRP
ncbi:MAG: hypothetical protein E3J21_03800 [Anaerolineales bacterium]|nr:MAG: hypothetical protein E3J21_03800 [Anaerolineales bacterium]